MSTRLAALTGFIFPATHGWRRKAAAGHRQRAVAPPPAAPAPEADRVVLQRMSQELGVPAATLRAQRDGTRLGWGDLLIAHRLAQKTGLTFEQVEDEYRAGALFHIVLSALASRRLGR